MNKFLELPLPQRLLILGIVLAVIGGGAYYLFISSVSDLIASQATQYKGLMNEYSKLKEYDSSTFKEKLDAQRAEALKRGAEYEKMLPSAKELPDLIASIKTDGDAAGLVVSKFEPSKLEESGPGYRGIPFTVEVVGNYHQLVNFLKALSAPSKRIVNARELSIVLAPPGTVNGFAGDVGILHVLLEREKVRGLSPNELYAKEVLLFEDNANRSILKASFTAVAYVYTGGDSAMVAGGAL